MKLIINEQEIDFTLENEKYVSEILNSVEETCEKDNATIISISLNDKNITADEIEKLSSVEIASAEKLELTTVSQEDILSSLKELTVSLEELCKNLEQLPVLLQQNEEKKCAEIISTFADNFDILCHLISLTSLFPAFFENKTVENLSLADFLKDFSTILTDFENSLQDKDIVLTGDLAEYEIKPRLESFISAIRSC